MPVRPQQSEDGQNQESCPGQPNWSAAACPGSHDGATNLVGPGRFELPTSPLSGVRSNQLSYGPVLGITSAVYRMRTGLNIGQHNRRTFSRTPQKEAPRSLSVGRTAVGDPSPPRQEASRQSLRNGRDDRDTFHPGERKRNEGGAAGFTPWQTQGKRFALKRMCLVPRLLAGVPS